MQADLAMNSDTLLELSILLCNFCYKADIVYILILLLNKSICDMETALQLPAILLKLRRFSDDDLSPLSLSVVNDSLSRTRRRRSDSEWRSRYHPWKEEADEDRENNRDG